MKNKITFQNLGLSASLLEAINKKGFEEPTEIQIKTIPIILSNQANIIAQAQTGTGKTAAFGLPLIELVNSNTNFVQVLILVPTRELAIQVSEEINSFISNKNLKITPIYGGQSITQQLRRLKKGTHIVVGTPGRVIDHINRKTLKLEKIDHLILDEADEMLNMGFIDDIEKIMKHTNKEKKTILFSATVQSKIKDLARKYMGDYEFIKVNKEQLAADLTEQIYFEVKASDKFEALCRIIDIEDDFYGLIFCRTKSDVDTVVMHLIDRGYDVDSLHGDISQAKREKTLENFKKRRINILVATDVAARGIDVNNLTHVINYSLPQNPESYIHRIGRTGRAGNEGTAITFITPGEYSRLMFIQKVAKTDIKKENLPKIEDIINSKKKKIHEDLSVILENEIAQQYSEWAQELLKGNDPENVLAALLNYCFEDEIDPETYSKIKEINESEKQLNQHGKARLFVALGKKDNLSVKKLINLILDKVAIKPKKITDIIVLDKFSFITVPFEKAEEIISSFKKSSNQSIISHAKKREKKK